MHNVTIELPAALQALAEGHSQVQVSAATVAQALVALQQRHWQVGVRVLTRGGRLRAHVNVFVDEQDIRARQGVDTELKPGQRLLIVASVAGG